MANSLVKLTLESNQYEQGLRQAQKMWKDFTDSIGLSTQKITAAGVAIGAVTTALKVAKDAFNNSRTSIDEWGRTVQSAQSLYDGFLNSLNNSDISGFLSRMDEIVSAARQAYDAMSDLELFTAFNQKGLAKSRAGYNKALDEYRLNPTAENKQRLSAANADVKANLEQAKAMTQQAYEKSLRSLAVNSLKSPELQNKFVELFKNKSWEDLERATAGYSSGKGLNVGSQYYYGNRVYDGRIQERSTGKWSDMSQEEKENFEFARAIATAKSEAIDQIQKIGAQFENLDSQIYSQDRMYNRMAGNNAKINSGGGRRGSGGSGVDIYGRISDEWQTAYRKSMVADIKPEDVEGPSGAFQALYDFEHQVTEILSPLESMQQLLQDLINYRDQAQSPEEYAQRNRMVENQQQAIKDFKGETDVTKGKTDKKSVAGALAGLATGMDQMVDGMEQIGIEVPEGVKDTIGAISGVATILTTISTIVTAIEALVAADTLIPFSNGGVVRAAMGYEVPGNYGFDAVPALLTSGEVVLNRAQQGVLASALQTGGLAGLQLEAVIAGEDIRLVINNNGRRTGRGEFIQTNFRG